MELKDCGVTYNEPVNVTLGNHPGEGKYRAAARYAVLIAGAPSQEIELTYRGWACSTGQPQEPALPNLGESKGIEIVPNATISAATEFLPINEWLRRLMITHHHQVRKREQSMLMRADVKVGLSVEDAIHFRNHIQGYSPHDEWASYDRSPAAMS